MKRIVFFLLILISAPGAWADDNCGVKQVRQLNDQAVEVVYNDGKTMTIDFYGPTVFRLFRDDQGGILRNPEAMPSAEILVANARRKAKVEVTTNDADIVVTTQPLMMSFIHGCMLKINRATGLFTIWHDGDIVSLAAPVEFNRGGYDLRLSMLPDEYYYGGGVQNGRFSHRGERIDIVNTNSWTDGGVCSPAPFFWSTAGYGVLCHTFKPGFYDFSGQEVLIHHDTDYLDMFFVLGRSPVDLLNGYYQLTGHPVLLPKFAFYEGHLNAYNRDYWKVTDEPNRGILFEDGKRYVESQKPVENGLRETLNGTSADGQRQEEAAYQFSARAVIDRYARYDMPLGWVLPNDGYGAGYGQAETLDGNIANLKAFGDYARSKGVEIGLWTQSNLHPIDSIPALLQRDIIKEVRDAGVRVLKTDVAWVGAGYSFGLNGVADVAQTMLYYGQQARPFIISLDGWAGTQRYAAIWTGDQTGGEWEYIRFHIPTYIGSGLSGQPNITSDMDGIFGGRNMAVNIRDFQWKTFTPMQLNMDGWGLNEKYPHALGKTAATINRRYLKLKSMLLPYTYTFAHEAIDGKPLIQAMFLSSPNPFTLGRRTQYQFLYGPSFLVAPIYQETKADADGNDIRNGIYLPEGIWHDYFTGEAYMGNCVMNTFAAPIWKLPVFVRQGAIIPMNNPNNNPSQIDPSLRILEIFPSQQRTSISVYDDDGTTDAYLAGASTTYQVEQQLRKGKVVVTINPATGKGYDGMPSTKRTLLLVNMTAQPRKVVTKVNGKTVKSEWSFGVSDIMKQIVLRERLQQLVVEIPPVSIYDQVEVIVDGVSIDEATVNDRPVTLPMPVVRDESESTAYSITPTWSSVEGADYYEIRFEEMLYTHIIGTEYTIDLLHPETSYQMWLRAVGKDGVSEWTDLTLSTSANPLEFAMKDLTATCNVADQPGSDISHLFDHDEKGEIWHTDWQNTNAVPFTIDIDMHASTELDRITYVPRDNAGNGTILAGTLQYSADGITWSEPQSFQWARNNKKKDISLPTPALTRFLRLHVTQAVGGFGSGAELYAFRKPTAKVLIPGDINQDGHIDENDLTSYLNYTGLRQGDSDFDGYVSVGDVNHNGLIDAQDISYVATQLEGGVDAQETQLAGTVTIKADQKQYNTGDEIVLSVVGHDLKAVNALSLVLPYNQQQMQFLGVESVAVANMRNMTNDRLHSNGDRVLYPTFVNIGKQALVEGSPVLFRIRFKALQHLSKVNIPLSGMLVDRRLESIALF